MTNTPRLAAGLGLIMLTVLAGGPMAQGQEAEPSAAITDPVIAELLAANQALAAKLAELRLEMVRLKNEATNATRERDHLAQFIEDHDRYGPAFEEYTFFRMKKEREAKAQRAVDLKTQREERARKARELREERKRAKDAEATKREPGRVLNERMRELNRAGFTAVGDAVAVGHMGYSYRTETDEELHYSPWLDVWYYDKDEKVDYSTMTLSGSVVHAAEGAQNLSIAIAFLSRDGKQIGSTTVQVNNARPGIPYPFTSEVAMASNAPFKKYRAWVLYLDPVNPEPKPEPDDGR